MERAEQLKKAAIEFCKKARMLPSVREVALIGSVAGRDSYPCDIDVAVVISGFDDIVSLAKAARQMSPICHSWDVFLFNQEVKHLGRICHRRECPGQSVECLVLGCGEPIHVKQLADFKFDPQLFFSSSLEILWFTSKESFFLAEKTRLSIVETKQYPVLQNIELRCVECGKRFLFTVGEQKIFTKRGFRPPKRCPDCRERKWLEGVGF